MHADRAPFAALDIEIEQHVPRRLGKNVETEDLLASPPEGILCFGKGE